MVPPEAFSTAAAQSSSDFCRGWLAGTQCEIFRSNVLSWADAGVEQTAKEAAKEAVTHNADSVFLIEIVSSIAGLRGPFVFIVIGYNHYCKHGGMPAADPGKQAYSTPTLRSLRNKRSQRLLEAGPGSVARPPNSRRTF